MLKFLSLFDILSYVRQTFNESSFFQSSNENFEHRVNLYHLINNHHLIIILKLGIIIYYNEKCLINQYIYSMLVIS